MIPISSLLFIVIFIVGCAATLLSDAVYGVYLYVFEYFLNPPGRWWGNYLPQIRYAFIIGVITIIAYLIRSRKYSANRIFDAPQTKWLMLFVIVMVCTLPIAVNTYDHKRFMIIFIKYFLLYLIILKTIDTPQKFDKLMGAFLMGQFYLGLLAYEVGRSATGRLEELGGADSRDANGTAAVMIVAIPILINYLIIGKTWQKIFALPILVFTLNAVILINSRGAFIGLIIAMVYYFFFSLKSPAFPKFNKGKVLLVVSVGIAIFVYLADPIFIDRMSTIANSEHAEFTGYTGRERIDFWFKTFDMLKDYPLGSGVWGYDNLSPAYLPPEALSANGMRGVHSLYFQVLAEYGFHGFIIFAAFLLANFKFLWKLKSSLRRKEYYEPYYMVIALEASFLAILVAGIFISTLYMEINYWMAAFFATYGSMYFKKMQQDQVTNEALS
jgi:O-antigen ligase